MFEGFPFIFIKKGAIECGVDFYKSLTRKQRHEILKILNSSRFYFEESTLILFGHLSIVVLIFLINFQIFQSGTEKIKPMTISSYMKIIFYLILILILIKARIQYFYFKFYQYYECNKHLFQDFDKKNSDNNSGS